MSHDAHGMTQIGIVSYGVGVFDDQNVLSIRYDLGRGWGVKATSGERQTGVDISYTVEN